MFMGIIQRICSLKKSKHFSITKHSKELEKIGIRNQQFEYDIAIKTWQKIYTDSSLTKEDKISLLQSIILSIKLALKYDYLASAIYSRKEGELLVDIVNTDPIFNFVYTDGAYWYNEYDDSVISIVLDFRIAVLFKYIKELEKLKLSLK